MEAFLAGDQRLRIPRAFGHAFRLRCRGQDRLESGGRIQLAGFNRWLHARDHHRHQRFPGGGQIFLLFRCPWSSLRSSATAWRIASQACSICAKVRRFPLRGFISEFAQQTVYFRFFGLDAPKILRIVALQVGRDGHRHPVDVRLHGRPLTAPRKDPRQRSSSRFVWPGKNTGAPSR